MVNQMDDINILQTTLNERNHNKKSKIYDFIHISTKSGKPIYSV